MREKEGGLSLENVTIVYWINIGYILLFINNAVKECLLKAKRICPDWLNLKCKQINTILKTNNIIIIICKI